MKQYHETQFLSYRPLTECSISKFCITNCTHSIFRTIEASVGFAWAFSEKVKKNSKITYTARRRVLTFHKRQSRLLKLRLIAGLPRAKRAWDRAPYPWNMVNLFSFGCHVIDRAYVRTYVRTRLQIVWVG